MRSQAKTRNQTTQTALSISVTVVVSSIFTPPLLSYYRYFIVILGAAHWRAYSGSLAGLRTLRSDGGNAQYQKQVTRLGIVIVFIIQVLANKAHAVARIWKATGETGGRQSTPRSATRPSRDLI